MKKYLRDLIVFILSIFISTFCDIKIDDFFMGTIYTVSSIMFSIGVSILVTFNLHNIKKKSTILRIRSNIVYVRNSFIKYFFLSTIFFVLERYLRKSKLNLLEFYDNESLNFQINISFIAAFLIFYLIIYYVINFVEVQKLNDEIFDNCT